MFSVPQVSVPSAISAVRSLPDPMSPLPMSPPPVDPPPRVTASVNNIAMSGSNAVPMLPATSHPVPPTTATAAPVAPNKMNPIVHHTASTATDGSNRRTTSNSPALPRKSASCETTVKTQQQQLQQLPRAIPVTSQYTQIKFFMGFNIVEKRKNWFLMTGIFVAIFVDLSTTLELTCFVFFFIELTLRLQEKLPVY